MLVCILSSARCSLVGSCFKSNLAPALIARHFIHLADFAVFIPAATGGCCYTFLAFLMVLCAIIGPLLGEEVVIIIIMGTGPEVVPYTIHIFTDTHITGIYTVHQSA